MRSAVGGMQPSVLSAAKDAKTMEQHHISVVQVVRTEHHVLPWPPPAQHAGAAFASRRSAR